MDNLGGFIGLFIILSLIGYTIDKGLDKIADVLEKIAHELKYPTKNS